VVVAILLQYLEFFMCVEVLRWDPRGWFEGDISFVPFACLRASCCSDRICTRQFVLFYWQGLPEGLCHEGGGERAGECPLAAMCRVCELGGPPRITTHNLRAHRHRHRHRSCFQHSHSSRSANRPVRACQCPHTSIPYGTLRKMQFSRTQAHPLW
jgi:hypothetical protein